MKKILAISVLVLFSNGAMGSQDAGIKDRMSRREVIGADYLGIKKPDDYLPREFWDDAETVGKVLDKVVPRAVAQAGRARCRPDARSWNKCREIIERLIPEIQSYMEHPGLPCPSELEIYGSIGQIPFSYYLTCPSGRRVEWTDEEEDNEEKNFETFLDYVGDIIGRPLSERAERALWLSEAE
jgi:hypothetical protein